MATGAARSARGAAATGRAVSLGIEATRCTGLTTLGGGGLGLAVLGFFSSATDTAIALRAATRLFAAPKRNSAKPAWMTTETMTVGVRTKIPGYCPTCITLMANLV